MIPFVSNPFINSMTSYSEYLLSRNLPGVHGQFTIYLAFAIYLGLGHFVYFTKLEQTFDKLIGVGLAVFSLLYGLGVWLPNWMLWGLPFVMAALFMRPRLFPTYMLINVFYYYHCSMYLATPRKSATRRSESQRLPQARLANRLHRQCVTQP